MAGQKYSRILGAAKYYSAIDNYIKYITDSSKRGSGVGKGKPRSPSKRLWIYPFTATLAGNQIIPVSASVPAITAYAAAVNGGTGKRVFDELPTDTVAIDIDNFQSARVIVTKGRTEQGVKATSKVTGLPYLKYGGSSSSLPFGEAVTFPVDLKAPRESYATAASAIKASISAAVTGAAISFRPEKL